MEKLSLDPKGTNERLAEEGTPHQQDLVLVGCEELERFQDCY